MLLDVQHLSASYLKKNECKIALQDINFSLEAGTITGIIGRNGAGKTTLLDTIAGLKEMESGSVFLNGNSLSKEPQRVKQYIAMVKQEDLFHYQYKLNDIASHLGIFYENFSKEKFDGYCNQFDLDKRRRYSSLSLGMKVKFSLAFALACQPKILLMDEPLEGLDPVFRREFSELLYDVAGKEECAVLYSTHMTEELEKMADYVLVLEKGKQLLFSDVNEIQDKYFKNEKSSLKSLLFQLTGQEMDIMDATTAEDRYWEV